MGGAHRVTRKSRSTDEGALGFIEKPMGHDELLTSVETALEHAKDATKLSARRENAKARIAALTVRQRQIMERVLAGHPNKNIAADLGISQRTVENHRATIMMKTGSKSLPALGRLAFAAGENGTSDLGVQLDAARHTE